MRNISKPELLRWSEKPLVMHKQKMGSVGGLWMLALRVFAGSIYQLSDQH